MAIEDAAVLARHVGPPLSAGARGASLDEALDAYERERRPINAAMIRSSHWMSCLFALGGPLGDMLHRRAFELANSWFGRIIQQRIWSRFATSPVPQYV